MNTVLDWGGGILGWVLQASWHAAVLAGLILLVQWLLRRHLSPGWRYGLWLLLVIRLLMPVAPQSTFSVFNLTRPLTERVDGPSRAGDPAVEVGEPAAPVDVSELGSALPLQQWPDSPSPPPGTEEAIGGGLIRGHAVTPWSWLAVGFIVWVIGVVLLGAKMVWAHLRFSARIGSHAPLSDTHCLRLLEACREALGIEQRVTLIETEEVVTPAIYGLGRKRLLLPDGILERFSREELRYIFLHELAHVKRRDMELNALVVFFQLVHWFNPMLWLAFRRMRADRELAADAVALSCSHADERIAYGETILKVVASTVRPSIPHGLVGIVESRAQLKERLWTIARHGQAKVRCWLVLGAMLVLGALALTDARSGSPQDAPPPRIGAGAAKVEHTLRTDLRRVVLRLVDYATEAPLTGATVRVEMEPAPVPKRELRTSEDGSVVVELPARGLRRFSYETAAPEYLSLHGLWREHQIDAMPEAFTVKLSRGVEIGGVVTGPTGQPLPGVSIFFDRPLNMLLGEATHFQSQVWSPPVGEELARTDARGVWRARCVWPTIRWAALRLRHADFADAVYSTELTKAMEAEGKGNPLDFAVLTNFTTRFQLEHGTVIEGTLVDESGRSLPQIRVRYADRASENPFWDRPLGKEFVLTDGQGQFRTRPLPRKSIFFSVQAEGYAPVVAELDLRLQAPAITLRLEKGQAFTGRAQDAGGNPLPGAQVALKEWSTWQGVSWATVTDGEGRFTWTDAPRGQFLLEIQRAGFITQRKIFHGGGDQPVVMKEKLRLQGRIADAQGGQAIQKFQLRCADREEYIDLEHAHVVLGSNGVYFLDLARIHGEGYSDYYFHDFVFRAEADGYVPATSRVFSSRNGDVGPLTYDVELKRASEVVGTVLDVENHPVAGAQVALKRQGMRLRLAGQPRFEPLDQVEWPLTDANGQFHLSQDPDATHLVVVHEKGIAWLDAKELSGSSSETIIRLKPWGRIEGTVWQYDQILINQEVWLDSELLADPRGLSFLRAKAVSDERGRFRFDFVPPATCSLSRWIAVAQGSAGGPRTVVDLTPGQTAKLKLGGAGRPVVGRFTIKNPYLPIDWTKDYHWAGGVGPQPPTEVKTPEEKIAWRRRADVQRAFLEVRQHPIEFSKDGSFRIDETLSGRYEFRIRFLDPRDPDAMAYSKYIDLVTRLEPFEVPENPLSDTQEPLDLGTMEVVLKGPLDDGQTAAADFTATGLDGKEFRLSQFAGKYVLLDFWATWCAPCIGELPYLRQAHDQFKSRKDFVMIGLSLDDAIEKPRDFAKKHELPWLQGHLAERAQSAVHNQYGIRGIPAIFLINPEGKIIATDLRGTGISKELGKWLK